MDQPTITTARFVLRPYRLSDAEAVEQLAGDRDVAETTLTMPHPYPKGGAAMWIGMHPGEWESRTTVVFAICTAQDELRGTVTLALKMPHLVGELGYWIGKPWWGQGIATEASAALLRFGFETLGLNRIQASYFPRNPASGRIMEKLGMAREGLHRAKYMKAGRPEDVIEHGILRSEWLEHIGRNKGTTR